MVVSWDWFRRTQVRQQRGPVDGLKEGRPVPMEADSEAAMHYSLHVLRFRPLETGQASSNILAREKICTLHHQCVHFPVIHCGDGFQTSAGLLQFSHIGGQRYVFVTASIVKALGNS